MKRTAMLFAGLLACAVAGAEEGGYSGNNLMEQCEAAVNPRFASGELDAVRHGKGMLCAGYVRGIADGYVLGAIDSTNKLICLPDGVYVIQIARIVIKFGQGDPELLHQPARLLVASALARSFPCKR